MESLEQQWNKAILNLNQNKEGLEVPADVKENLQILVQTSLATRLIEWYLDAVCRNFRECFDERLHQWRETWVQLQKDNVKSPNKDQIFENWICKSYIDFIHNIYSHFNKCQHPLILIVASDESMKEFLIRYHTTLYLSLIDKSEPYSTIPSLFKEMTKIFFRSFFRKYENLIRYNPPNSSDSSSLLLCKSKQPDEKFENILFVWRSTDDINILFSKQEDNIENEENSFSAMELDDTDLEEFDVELPLEDGTKLEDLNDEIEAFSKLCKQMHSLDLIKRTNDALEEFLCDEIELRVQNTCKGTFDKPMLRHSTKWLYSTLYPWLQIIFSSNSQLSHESIEKLFDVIVDFPDSKIAIDDLIVCMRRLDKDYRYRLVESLHAAFRKRLLIPGAGTMDIINTYISTIKCLRLLDSSGVLLEKITGPFRNYLRTREDAARCLVSSWMDEKNNNNELIEELGRTEEPIDNQQDVRFNDDNWLPDPMDAGPDYKSSIYRSADITNLLVSLFDTTDLIIKEIQNQMASYLLTKTDYDTEKELTKLELFKLRFGESKMSTTEVMIKDISDSKRIDSFILGNDNPLRRNMSGSSSEVMMLHGTVISRLFWPTLKGEDFDVPEQISNEMVKYDEGFQIFKPRRKLQWLKSLGKQQDKWNLVDLAKKIKIDPIILKGKMNFWSDRGILKELPNDEWLLLETAEEVDPSKRAFASNEENCDNIIQSLAEQKAEEFKMYWAYIENMLKNLGGMTLEKIHNILCSVAEPTTSSSNSSFDNNLEDLKSFLNQMVVEDKLEFQGGLYKAKIN
ncbi:2648_t:CDS:10 [Rhizophagus irregularis]|nr:2648_t:CDS:10 [Rhizophagus irregularis]